MKTHYENDVIHLLASVTADVVAEGRELVIPVGTAGVVVFVHGDPEKPAAYEIEFYVREQNCYALATVEFEKIA